MSDYMKKGGKMADMNKKNKRGIKKMNTLTAWFFLSPWLIGFVLFSAFPFFYSMYLSFCEVLFTYTGIQTQYIGFRNFIRALLGQGQLDFVPALIAFAGTIIVYIPL